MAIAQKIRIYPNKRQQALLDECFGYSRWCANTALDTWKTEYQAGQKPTQRKVRDIMKVSLPDWAKEYPKSIIDTACEHLRFCFRKFLCSSSKASEVQVKTLCKAEF